MAKPTEFRMGRSVTAPTSREELLIGTLNGTYGFWGGKRPPNAVVSLDRKEWAGLMAEGRFRGALELAKNCGDEKCTRAAALALYGFLMRQAYEYGNVNLYLDARKVAMEHNFGPGRVRAAERGMNEVHPAHRND